MIIALIKPTSYRDEDYRAWIRTFRCLICDSFATEAAHTGAHGLSTKADDFRVIPLCEKHHRGTEGLDRLGPKAFEEKYNLDLKEWVLKFIGIYLGLGNCLGTRPKKKASKR